MSFILNAPLLEQDYIYNKLKLKEQKYNEQFQNYSDQNYLNEINQDKFNNLQSLKWYEKFYIWSFENRKLVIICCLIALVVIYVTIYFTEEHNKYLHSNKIKKEKKQRLIRKAVENKYNKNKVIRGGAEPMTEEEARRLILFDQAKNIKAKRDAEKAANAKIEARKKASEEMTKKLQSSKNSNEDLKTYLSKKEELKKNKNDTKYVLEGSRQMSDAIKKNITTEDKATLKKLQKQVSDDQKKFESSIVSKYKKDKEKLKDEKDAAKQKIKGKYSNVHLKAYKKGNYFDKDIKRGITLASNGQCEPGKIFANGLCYTRRQANRKIRNTHRSWLSKGVKGTGRRISNIKNLRKPEFSWKSTGKATWAGIKAGPKMGYKVAKAGLGKVGDYFAKKSFERAEKLGIKKLSDEQKSSILSRQLDKGEYKALKKAEKAGTLTEEQEKKLQDHRDAKKERQEAEGTFTLNNLKAKLLFGIDFSNSIFRPIWGFLIDRKIGTAIFIVLIVYSFGIVVTPLLIMAAIVYFSIKIYSKNFDSIASKTTKK